MSRLRLTRTQFLLTLFWLLTILDLVTMVAFSYEGTDNRFSVLNKFFRVDTQETLLITLIVTVLFSSIALIFSFVQRTRSSVEFVVDRLLQFSPLLIVGTFAVGRIINRDLDILHLLMLVLLIILAYPLILKSIRTRDTYSISGENIIVPFWELLSLVFGLLCFAFISWRIVGVLGGGFTNPDGLGYMHIARQYSEGDFVVRGYWSPLISWLAALLTITGLSLHSSMFTVLAFSGGCWIAATWLLAKRLAIASLGRLSAAACIAIISLGYLITINTDVISAALITFIIYVLLDDRLYKHIYRFALIFGLLGAITYYAKAYNLPFVILLMILFALYSVVKGESLKKIYLFFGSSLFIFVLLIAPWIFALSARYDHFTFSTSGSHTRGLVAPGASRIVCWSGVVLCDQPEDVLFPWEDHLPEYQPNYDWSPFDSLELFTHQIQLLARNLNHWMAVIVYPLLATVLLVLVYIYNVWDQQIERRKLLWLLTVALGYSGGFMLTLSGYVRYTYPSITLFILLIIYAIQYSSESLVDKYARVLLMFFAYGLLFAIISAEYGGRAAVARVLYPNKDYGRCISSDTKNLGDILVEPIASVDENDTRIAHFTSYYNRVRTFGGLHPNLYSPEEINQRFHDFGIKTAIVRDASNIASELIETYDYELVQGIKVCNTDYTVLRVP